MLSTVFSQQFDTEISRHTIKQHRNSLLVLTLLSAGQCGKQNAGYACHGVYNSTELHWIHWDILTDYESVEPAYLN